MSLNLNSLVMFNPRLPFGGIKQSGYGREFSALGYRVRKHQDGLHQVTYFTSKQQHILILFHDLNRYI